MNRTLVTSGGSLALVGAIAFASLAGAQGTGDITLGERVHPESIAATPDGGLIIGSVGLNVVLRALPGETVATPWISADRLTEGGGVYGVFAHGVTAYVCADGEYGTGVANLMTFDLVTGDSTGTFPFPGGGFCNDIAVGPDGTAYVADTVPVGRILALDPGATELRVVISDAALAGIDGVAFIGSDLYANNVRTGELYRIDIGAGTYSTLTTSRPLEGPDGMRTTGDGAALLLTENAGGRLVRLVIDGDSAVVEDLAAGFETPTGVAQLGDTAYVVEAKFGPLFDPTLPDPGVFLARAVSLAVAGAATSGAEAPVVDPAADLAALMMEGQQLYQRNCQSCHGAQGEGGAGERLVASQAVSRAGGLINRILEGSPAHGMPPFDRLNNREIAAVATFVRNSWTNAFGVVTEAMVGQVRPQ